MASQTYKSWLVVTASTTAFTVCFMVWMMFAVIGIPIKQTLGLNETQFGVGNTGAAVTKLVAPTIVVAFGWAMVPQVYAVLMLITAVLFWYFTFTDGDHATGASHVTVKEQLMVLKDPTVWRYSQYYSIVFGGYVALSLWMTKYYISEYGFDIQVAALLAAGFSIPGGVLRAIGGWFSDKYGAHLVTWGVLWGSLVCLFFLSYPPNHFTVHTVTGPRTFHLGIG